MNIISKKQFTRLWEAGRLGNKPIIWPTIDAAERSGYPGMVAVRYCGPGMSGPFRPNLQREDLRMVLTELCSTGWKESDFYVHEHIPTGAQLMNAEVRWSRGDLFLYYSTVPTIMRESLAAGGRQVKGLIARKVLSTLVFPDELDSLYRLLDEYPEHCVEFTSYRARYGTEQTHLIIWEVRLY